MTVEPLTLCGVDLLKDRDAQIRADERAKCVAEIRALNASRIGYEWVLGSTWANIIERAARHIERKG